MPEAVVLLPPADSKKQGGRPGTRYADARRDPHANRFRDLDAAREDVASALHKALESGEDLESLLDAKGALLTAAIERNAFLYESPVLPALERYGGAFYRSLGYGELPAKAREVLSERALVVSGLLGLVSPTDLVPDYKLPLEKALPGIGALKEYWRPRITPVLDAWTSGRVVWNLLPPEIADAWTGGRDAAVVMDVRFVDRRNGRERCLAHTNRMLKGAFARHLATRGWAVASAERFEIDGYRFDAGASATADGRGTIVFARTT